MNVVLERMQQTSNMGCGTMDVPMAVRCCDFSRMKGLFHVMERGIQVPQVCLEVCKRTMMVCDFVHVVCEACDFPRVGIKMGVLRGVPVMHNFPAQLLCLPFDRDCYLVNMVVGVCRS